MAYTEPPAHVPIHRKIPGEGEKWKGWGKTDIVKSKVYHAKYAENSSQSHILKHRQRSLTSVWSNIIEKTKTGTGRGRKSGTADHCFHYNYRTLQYTCITWIKIQKGKT